MKNFNEIFRKDVPYDNIKSHKNPGFSACLKKIHFSKNPRGAQIDPAVLGLRGWDGYFECHFKKNMKDAFNEGLPYITHFLVLHLFLRRPQVLLTYTRLDIYYIKSNLKLAFSLEYSSNNSILLVYIANCSGIYLIGWLYHFSSSDV